MAEDKLESPPSTDVEAAIVKEGPIEPDRPHYPAWQWILSVIGLYLGGLLYGTSTAHPLPCSLTDIALP